MPKPTMYRLEVAPLTAISLRRSPLFSYSATVSVPTGSLVRIPFGRRALQGIVFDAKPLSKIPHWMKSIQSVEHSAHLTQSQLALAQFLSESSLTSLGLCLKHFVVPLPKRETRSTYGDNSALASPPPLSATAERLIRKVRSEKQPVLLTTVDGTHIRETLSALALSAKEKGCQVLVLVPETFLAEWWYRELEAVQTWDRPGLIHSRRKTSELSTDWERIRSGQATLILGTRQALFAPFTALDTIVVMDAEEEVSYKQWEMSPRYASQHVARELVRLFRSALLFVTPTPDLGTLRHLETKEVRLAPAASAEELAEVTIVDRRLEKRGGTRHILSTTLLEAIHQVHAKREPIVLIGRQRGWSLFSVCAHCKSVLRCPKCDKTLVGARAGHFHCLHCGYTTDVFPVCRTCGHLTFKSFGAGTEKIEGEVQKHLPEARIVRFDGDAKTSRRALETTLERLRHETYDILIGTPGLANIPRLPRPSLIAMMEADGFLAFPDYRGEERLLRVAHRLRRLAGKTGRVLIQTFDPHQPVFAKTIQPFEPAMRSLLEERESLRYPPFFRLLRIECRGKTSEEKRQLATTLTRAIEQLAADQSLPLVVNAPIQSSRATKKAAPFVLVRLATSTPWPESLRKVLLRFSDHCIFDFDPLHLT